MTITTHNLEDVRSALVAGATVRIRYVGEPNFSSRKILKVYDRGVQVVSDTSSGPCRVPIREGDEFEITPAS